MIETLHLYPDMEDATILASKGFESKIDENFLRNVVGTVYNTDFCTSALNSGRVVGYCACKEYSFNSQNILYISGIMVDPNIQSREVGLELIKLAATTKNYDYLSFRTQSARMYRLGQKCTEFLYPVIPFKNNDEMPEDISNTADWLCKLRGVEFPISKGYFGSSLYGNTPEYINNPDFYTQVDIASGDAVFCIGKLSLYNL